MPNQETYDRKLDEPSRSVENNLGRVPDKPYYQQPAGRGGARVAGAVLLAIGLIWLLMQFGNGLALPFGVGGGTLLDNTYSARRLVVDVGAGDVEVRTWNQATMRVEAMYRGGDASDYAVSVEPNGETLTIRGGAKPAFQLFGRRDVRYRISMPAGANAQIKTTNGDIDVAGLSGETKLDSTNGDIQATELARGLTVSTVNGDIELDTIAGTLQANSTNGEIQLGDGAVENARVETVGGDINLEGVAGELFVKSVNGDIVIADGREAKLTLESVSSDIHYEGDLAPGGTNIITNVSGDVDLRLPENSGFELRASTASGDITSEFTLKNQQQDRRNLSGKVNDGGATLQISTTNGDINLGTP